MLNNKTFQKLSEIRSPHCVSMYVPAHQTRRGMESKSFFKRILTDVTEELTGQGMSGKEAHRFLFNAYELLNEQLYWNNLNHGFGIFVSDGFFEMVKIPNSVDPYYMVAERFYLSPLIPALSGQGSFYVLALNEEGANLYKGDRFSLQPVGAGEILPEDMEEAMAEAGEGDNLQMRSGQPAFETPVFKGQEGELGSQHKLKQLKRYFYQIDERVNMIIKEERAPLVIAAPGQMVPVYKETSKYLDITPVHISGKPDADKLDSLHEKAVEIIDNYFTGLRKAQLKNFNDYQKDGRTSSDIQDILPRAVDGDIETLFIARNKHCWGQYDEESGDIEKYDEKEPNRVDLLSLAATYTHLNDGKAYFLSPGDMPQPSASISAIFRSS